MLFSVYDIREGLDLDFTLTSEEVDALMAITNGDLRGGVEGGRVTAHVTRLDSTILVRGESVLQLRVTCGRCRGEVVHTERTEIDAVLMDAASFEPVEGDAEVELSAEDMGVSFYTGDEIDLSDIVREAVLLELPAYPTCEAFGAECSGEAGSGAWTDAADDAPSDGIDPRWAALKRLRDASKKS